MALFPTLRLLIVFLIIKSLIGTSLANFYSDFIITWGDGRGKILDNGNLLTLSLDNYSGSGFESRNEFLFASIHIKIKLIPNNSAGTVTSYYLSSKGQTWDEIDFEFLGNLPGEPYILQTNVFYQGKGNREQRIHLWFDPTIDFHTYTIVWNPKRIMFFVDRIPIREYKNGESKGFPFPSNQPMKIYATLWNGDSWATDGGKVKIDWSQAPFVASYRNSKSKACVVNSGVSSCGTITNTLNRAQWLSEELDERSLKKLKWVQNKYMFYNYCNDKTHPNGFPIECHMS